MVQLSHLYMTTGKAITWTIWAFVPLISMLGNSIYLKTLVWSHAAM